VLCDCFNKLELWCLEFVKCEDHEITLLKLFFVLFCFVLFCNVLVVTMYVRYN